MFRALYFCFVLANVSVAFGQQRATLNGVEGTFFPNTGELTPVPDSAFREQQQVVMPETNQHGGNCSCPVCARRVLSQQTRERSKTIREIMTVTVVEETHPTRIINNPQPVAPQNPCLRQRQGGGAVLPTWNTGFVGYRRQWQSSPRPMQKQCCVNLFGLVRISATSGPSGYAQPRYYGDPGYGGLGYSSQPVRPW